MNPLHFNSFASARRQPGCAHVVMVCLVLVGLSACSKGISDPPQPRLTSGQAAAAPPTTPVVAVPSADSVLGPSAVAPNTNAAAGRSNTSLSTAQESNAMPLPGQNNDHSAPVVPSSAPKR